MSLTPYVQLIGKNANNRDVTLSFSLDELPANEAEWIAKAKEQGFPVDEAKTRGNIVVGQHYGFHGLIRAYDFLDDVLLAKKALDVVDVMPFRNTPPRSVLRKFFTSKLFPGTVYFHPERLNFYTNPDDPSAFGLLVDTRRVHDETLRNGAEWVSWPYPMMKYVDWEAYAAEVNEMPGILITQDEDGRYWMVTYDHPVAYTRTLR